jgi:methyl-accepting chemotaxis protein
MEIKWTELSSLNDWALTLKRMLGEAEKAIKADNRTAKENTKKLLLEFSRRAPFKLRETAVNASIDLSNSIIDDAIEAIAGRNEELLKLVGEIKDTTSDVKNAEELISFQVKRIMEGLDYMGKTVVILQEVQKDLGDKNADLSNKVKSVLDSVQQLHTVAKSFKAEVVNAKPA